MGGGKGKDAELTERLLAKGNGSRTRALAGRERNEVEARFHRTDTSKGMATLASLQGGSGFGCFSNL